MEIKDLLKYDKEKNIFIDVGLGLMEISEIEEKEDYIILNIGEREE